MGMRTPRRTSSNSKEDENEEFYKPVIVGSYAQWLAEESSAQKTHQWTIYLRGLDDEDLSYFIEKVVFYLHESFPEPARTLTKPPYEVTEHGWGEFEIKVKVFFKGANVKPVEFHHYLRLYNNPDAQPTIKPVIHDVYDEFVFVDPPDDLRAALEKGPKDYVQSYTHKCNLPFLSYCSHVFIVNPMKLADKEEQQLVRLLQSHQQVLQKMYYYKKRLQAAEENLVTYKEKLNSCHAR